LARAFARQGYHVLAIDGDNNPNLGIALGIPPDKVDEASQIPQSPLDLDPETEGVKAITDLAGRLKSIHLN
jgi:CO dehydrogenase nickel-insertion accessory protein CooC1